MTVRSRSSGNRRAVPADAMKFCPTCAEPRGNKKKDWSPIYKQDQILGWTCPACPVWDEPIRRLESGRFRAVVDATPPGALKRKQATKTVDTLEQAREFVAKVRHEVSSAGGFVRNDETVDQLCQRWLEGRVNVRANTRDTYVNELAWSERNWATSRSES